MLHSNIAELNISRSSVYYVKFCISCFAVDSDSFNNITHSFTAALDQLRVVASSTSNDPGPRSRQHQQIGQRLLPLAAANFSVDDPAAASSQQREECRCG